MGTRSQTFRSTFVVLLQRTVGLPRAWRVRRELTRLVDLDDRMLADIGLTRHDVVLALAEPLSVDASESLAAMVRRAG